jgi:hypothetical protein
MSIGSTMVYHLQDGWTLRKVASTMVREWLQPFRAEPATKATRWVIQSVMEEVDEDQPPLWEPGISTEEYERRLDEANLRWCVRATAGRGKGTILARFSMCDDRPDSFEVACTTDPLPAALFDPEKVDEYLKGRPNRGMQGLIEALLNDNGFEAV